MKGSLNTTFTPQNTEYVVKLKKQNWWWLLLLLLLLPLLLLIPFKKSFDVKTLYSSNKSEVPKTDVFVQYKDYQLFNFQTKKFFTRDTITLFDVSDDNAIAHFKDIKYTLYALIFHFNNKITISGSNDCFYGDTTKKFLSVRNHSVQELLLSNRTYNYNFTVLDAQSKQPIPNAKVKAKVVVNGQTLNWQGVSAPDGTVYFENFPFCGEFEITTEADGFNTKIEKGQAEDLYNPDNRNIWLDADKNTINFFVRDLYTHDPLPNTKAELIINGNVVQTVYTNVNGVAMSPGEGVFENIQGNTDFTIHTQHIYYHDTTRTDNVSHWKSLTDSDKIIYMRPEAQSLRFRDVDGNIGVPAAQNDIYVNGKKVSPPVYSDANGYFSIAGLKPDDVVSITASKPGYETNDYTIKNRKVSDLLSAPQSSRNIPLTKKQQPTPPPPNPPPNPQPNPQPNPEPIPPVVFPCDSPQEAGGQGVTERVHSIGNSGKFSISWDMYSVPDQLIIYCGSGANKRQIFTTRGAVSGQGQATLNCTEHYITVKIIGQQSGTQWQYKMNCQ